jgi:hypothetical protein
MGLPLLKDARMAGKPRNRLELRRQYDAAEPPDPMEDESDAVIEDGDDDEDGERKPKKKPKAAKPKAKTTKAAKPAVRMRIVWTVVNDAFKPVATFDYNQKDAAETKAAELTAKGKGTYFIQKVKEPMPDNAPGLGANLPRPVAPPPAPVAVKASRSEEDEDDEVPDEDEIDAEPDMDEDDADEE